MIRSQRPATPLRHVIRYYYGVENNFGSQPVLQPVPARSPQIIEFTFGTPFGIHEFDRRDIRSAHTIALVGAHTARRLDLVMNGKIDTFTIVFQPGGVSALFSIPAAELTNRDFDGEQALGRGLGELQRRLGDAATFAERVLVADDFLVTRRPDFDSAGGVVGAAKEIHRKIGRIAVSHLAHGTGLGIRQFERRFCREIGMPPKLYARVIRFEAALRRKAAVPGTKWTDIAHALGYHDQMHMVRDFKHLSGDSPSAICDRLDMFVQPEMVSGGQPL